MGERQCSNIKEVSTGISLVLFKYLINAELSVHFSTDNYPC